MSSQDEALREHAMSTGTAVCSVLETFLPGQAQLGEAEIVPAGDSPLEGVSVPAVAAHVSYIDGASGGTVFVSTVRGMRLLAAAMMGNEPVDQGQPLDDVERSAVAEAMSQMMTAAAQVTSAVLDEEVAISAPEVREIQSVTDAVTLSEGASRATGVSVLLAGEPCRIVQLVPKAFVLRMTRALDDRNAVDLGGERGEAPPADGGRDDILRSVPLRVCAEIGRATMPVDEAVSLPEGGLLELDRGADEPVDVLVNGRRFATGRLVLVDDEWAVRIDEVLLDAADIEHAPPSVIERG